MIWKRRYKEKILWRIYMCVMVLVVAVFVYRVDAGASETELSNTEVIKLSKQYSMGKFYDRNGVEIKAGDVAFQEIIGADKLETASFKLGIAGAAPWTFGTEDEQFRLKYLYYPKQKRVGGDTQITYDIELQHYVAELAKDSGYKDVRIVVSNWKTGEILATHGDVYSETLHLGSTMKPILAAAVLSIEPKLKDYTYDCNAESHDFKTKDGTYHIACSGNRFHGMLYMEKALAKSCNGYFISLLREAPREKVLEVLKRWGFDSVLSFSQFWYSDHVFLGAGKTEADYLMGAIGQANAKITPFGLNICTNALVSGTGSVAEPKRILAKTSTYDGEWTSVEAEKNYRFCEPEVAETVKKMMLEVTKTGTGKGFAMKNFAAKTGTAQSGKKWNTVWTTGGLTEESTPYSVTVCLNKVPKDTSGSVAGKLAREILVYMTGGKK